MRHVLGRLGLGALALLPVAVLLGGCGDSNSDDYAARCDPAAKRELPDRDGLRTPARLQGEAIRMLRADPEVQELTGGREFEPGRPIPWSSGDAQGAWGFVIPMSFRVPFSASSEEWPVIVYPGAGRPEADSLPRLICRIAREVEGITRIEATVNLTAGRVEQLSPNGSTTVDGYMDLDIPEEYTPVPGY